MWKRNVVAATLAVTGTFVVGGAGAVTVTQMPWRTTASAAAEIMVDLPWQAKPWRTSVGELPWQAMPWRATLELPWQAKPWRSV